MEWTYQGKPILSAPDSYIGFVYLITNLLSGKQYIGKKLLTKAKTRMVKKRKKRSRVESDWATYYGSSADLLADVALLGAENFKREILRFCSSKAELSYHEAAEQFSRGVLLSKDYYNKWISCKIRKTSQLRS